MTTAAGYVPAPWLPGPHAMTIFARLARGPRGLSPRRERWELDDGDFIDVDRHGDPDAPTIVVLHGLEGSSRAPYVRRLVAATLARGISALALNFRGCSGELNRLPRFYHSGDTRDLDTAVARLVTERPGRPVGVAGFSLGGNMVAKWLGEQGDGLPREVRAGAVISVPFDLARCARSMDAARGIGAFYRERFLRTLRRKAIAKARRVPGLPFETAAVRACRTFAQYDERVTAPLHGFAGAIDYWTRASSRPHLPTVRRPLLVIAAEDDPIVPPEALPLAEAETNRHLQLEVHPAGGHVGFVAGRPWRLEFFAEARAAEFLDEALRR